MDRIDYTGQTIEGRYRIIRLLGMGGMGSVYLGEHIAIGKTVAVKFLHSAYASKEGAVKRFYREAQAAAAIGHRNIIDVMDVGVSKEGEPYIVMEYLEGESLASMLDRTGPIDLAAACGILESALQALSVVHDKGIIHRDLKPENIFLVCLPGESPTIKLIDFGVSKFTPTAETSSVTKTGALIGTPAYMSPEQARGAHDVDHRTDIYSMGVILYRMLTGKMPFEGENYHQLLINVLTTPPRQPSSTCEGFPAEAEPLVMQALEKDPDKRPSSAGEMLEQVRQLSTYDQRDASLSHYASGIAQTTFAGGNLGETISGESGGHVAFDVLAKLSNKETLNGWSGTESVIGRRSFVLRGVLIALAIAGITVVISLYIIKGPDTKDITALDERLQNQQEQTWPAVVDPSSSGAEDIVQLEITDMPEGATIYYNEASVPVNPFFVRTTKTIARIRVSAPGYRDLVKHIVPSKDLVVEARLVAEQKITAQPVSRTRRKQTKRTKLRSNQRRAKPKQKPVLHEPTRAPPTKSPESAVKKNSLGTVFTETFE